MNDPEMTPSAAAGQTPADDATHSTLDHAADDARLDALIDRAAAGVHGEEPSDAVVQSAIERTWSRLQGGDAQMGADGATDYRTLIPAFLAGGLSAAQRMLMADQMRENPAFRAEVEALRTGRRRLDLTAVNSSKAAAARPSRWTRGRLGAAVATLAVAAAVGVFAFGRDFVQPNRVLAQVADVDGALVTVADAAGAHALAVGDAIHPRQALRASGGGAVVTLTDGSKLELDDRSQVSLRSRWDGLAIHLDRGNLIVQASDQGSGHLVVDTDDVGISVQGTIFSVRHGTKGSRVSVVEGAVKVSGAAGNRTLGGGDQYVSNTAVGAVPVTYDVRWSRDRARYDQMLSELAQLGHEIDQAVQGPAPRKASQLVGRLPADTAVVVALPNLGPTLAEQYKLFESRVAAYPALKEWWAANMADPKDKARIDALVEAVAKVGDQVGDEVVISLRFGADGEPTAPVVMATVADPVAFRRELEARFADLTTKMSDGAGHTGDQPALAILTDRTALDAAAAAETARDAAAPDTSSTAPADAAPNADGATADVPDASEPSDATDAAAGDRLQVWLGDGIVAASPAALSLQPIVEAKGGLEAGFKAAVDAAYGTGIDALVAVDLQRIVKTARDASAAHEAHVSADGSGAESADSDKEDAAADDAAGDDVDAEDDPGNDAESTDHADAALDFTGMADARYFVLTQVEVDGRSQLEANATFDGARKGAAAWLAEPGPMGALDFISPEAYVAGAAVIAEPETIVAQFLGLADRVHGDSDHGDADHEDGDATDADKALATATLTQLAKGLGGEIAFAIDGPLLPKPAWKMIVEVNDAAAVQGAIQAAVDGINARMASEPMAAGRHLALASETTGGRTVWSLTVEGGEAPAAGDHPTVIHWLYADGYLVAAADTPLLLQALKTRDSGVNLIDAPAFRASLPAGVETDFSALVWQDIGRLTKAVSGGASSDATLGDAAGGQGAASAATALSDMAGKLAPSLIYAWAEPDRLRFAASSDMSPFSLGLLLQLLGGTSSGGGPAVPGLPLPSLPSVPSLPAGPGGSA